MIAFKVQGQVAREMAFMGLLLRAELSIVILAEFQSLLYQGLVAVVNIAKRRSAIQYEVLAGKVGIGQA